LILSGYFAFFEWIWNGQTPGKSWLKLRVIREDGRPVTFWKQQSETASHFRYDAGPILFDWLDLSFVSASDQRVGDMIAGTVVVREREAEAPLFAQVFESAVSDLALRRSFKPVEFSGELKV